MFNILSFLQGGWPLIEKGGLKKIRGMIYKEDELDTQGNCVIYDARVIKSMYRLSICLYVNSFSQNLYVARSACD